MNERQAIILDAAEAFVIALERLSELRKQRRQKPESDDYKSFLTRGQEKGFFVQIDEDIRAARQARKRCLARLRRAIDRCRPLTGQIVMFDVPETIGRKDSPCH